jgi:hypothetical protein
MISSASRKLNRAILMFQLKRRDGFVRRVLHDQSVIDWGLR